VLALNAPRLRQGEQRVLNVAAGKACTAAEVAETVRRIIPGSDIEIGDTLTPLEQENVKIAVRPSMSRRPSACSAGRRNGRWSKASGIRRALSRIHPDTSL